MHATQRPPHVVSLTNTCSVAGHVFGCTTTPLRFGGGMINMANCGHHTASHVWYCEYEWAVDGRATHNGMSASEPRSWAPGGENVTLPSIQESRTPKPKKTRKITQHQKKTAHGLTLIRVRARTYVCIVISRPDERRPYLKKKAQIRETEKTKVKKRVKAKNLPPPKITSSHLIRVANVSFFFTLVGPWLLCQGSIPTGVATQMHTCMYFFFKKNYRQKKLSKRRDGHREKRERTFLLGGGISKPCFFVCVFFCAARMAVLYLLDILR